MAKKQKKTKKVNETVATDAWMKDTLQQVADAMVKQVGGPLPSSTVLMARVVGGEASGLLMGTHENGTVDAAIYIHYTRLLPVVHAFQRIVHGWDIFNGADLDMVPDGKLPPQPGEDSPEGAVPPPAPEPPSEPEAVAVPREVVVAA